LMPTQTEEPLWWFLLFGLNLCSAICFTQLAFFVP